MSPTPVIVAPEPGLTTRASRFYLELKANGIGCGFATVCNRLTGPRHARSAGLDYSSEATIIGDMVKDRDCIIVDDMIDTVYPAVLS